MKELKLNKSVFLLGRVKNPYAFLAKAGVYISCSQSEGFPNALIEAMICGIPVISSDCFSGPREILSPETPPEKKLKTGCEFAEYGVLCAINDKDAYIKAIIKLLTDKKIYNNYLKKGLERAKDFSINKISNSEFENIPSLEFCPE